jgi:polyhydroxyalkanoate synthesis regulator phasin
MFNQSALLAVYETIEHCGWFGIEDFAIAHTPSALTVTYHHAPGVEFRVTSESRRTVASAIAVIQGTAAPVGKSESDPIVVEMTPGELRKSERRHISSQGDLTSALLGWLDGVNRDLEAAPQYRRLKARQSEFESILAKLMEDVTAQAGEAFTQAEANAYRNRLDQLETRLAEAITEGVEDRVARDKKISELHSTVEQLKQQVEGLDKRTAARLTFTRLISFFMKDGTRKLVKEGFDLTKSVADAVASTMKLLGGGS